MATWYVEARPDETWSEVSHQFMSWVMENAPIQNFGCSEGDSIVMDGRTFFCFDFPDRYGKDIDRFPSWARTTGKLHGWARDGRVHFAHDRTVVHVLPEKASIKPPWLR